jgi:hypothetical protein
LAPEVWHDVLNAGRVGCKALAVVGRLLVYVCPAIHGFPELSKTRL